MSLSTFGIQFQKGYDKYARVLFLDKIGCEFSEEEIKAVQVQPAEASKFGESCTKVRCSRCRTSHSKSKDIVFHLVDIHHFKSEQISKRACVVDGNLPRGGHGRLHIVERLWTDRYRDASHPDNKGMSTSQTMSPLTSNVRKCTRDDPGSPEDTSLTFEMDIFLSQMKTNDRRYIEKSTRLFDEIGMGDGGCSVETVVAPSSICTKRKCA